MNRILRKNLNLIRHYGPRGLLGVYMKAMIWYSYRMLTGASRYKKIKVNDYDMYIDLKSSGISKALFIYGRREVDQMYIIENNLRRDAKVLDIGANIGYYVLLESRIMDPLTKIIAYEPSSEHWLLLKKNIQLNNLNDRVEANNAAVSNKSGVSTFYLSDRSNLHTLNPVRYKGRAVNQKEQKHVEVKTVDIYKVIGEHKDIRFIRMDIEGHEVEVFDGLIRTVKDFKVYPDILFETHFTKYDNGRHSIKDKLQSMFELGYFPKALSSNDEPSPKLRQRGYRPKLVLGTDRVDRGIYEGVSKKDAIDLISDVGGVRAVLLRKR